jgi:hypothetical protein
MRMITIDAVIRVARPKGNLEQITKMYAHGLGFEVNDGFDGFDGHGDFSGCMLGNTKHHHHLEFTKHTREKAGRGLTL